MEPVLGMWGDPSPTSASSQALVGKTHCFMPVQCRLAGLPPTQPGAAAGSSWGWRFPGSLAPGFLLFFRAAVLPATGRSQHRAAGGPLVGTSASQDGWCSLCAHGTTAASG